MVIDLYQITQIINTRLLALSPAFILQGLARASKHFKQTTGFLRFLVHDCMHKCACTIYVRMYVLCMYVVAGCILTTT